MVKTVVVGMSGGVDSSLAACLLKQQGYHVMGLFMKNWEDTKGSCRAAMDFEDVAQVCNSWDIPYYAVNFAQEYRDRVFADFLTEIQKGRTPNPDILCNREIKFKAFFEKAKELGADFLATGHYCQKIEHQGRTFLARGADTGKDQSYFLYAIQGEVLQQVLFPIGHLPKSEVRRQAAALNLCTAGKKDSTGICFIGKRDFTQFLAHYVHSKPGPIESVEGKKLGQHRGIAFYTLGQRKGLGIGGAGEAWFVVHKDLERNVLIVAQGDDHPALYHSHLTAQEVHWITEKPTMPFTCTAKVRYRQADQLCWVEPLGTTGLSVRFDVPQRAVTPGQSIVFYQGELCLGGAIIDTIDR